MSRDIKIRITLSILIFIGVPLILSLLWIANDGGNGCIFIDLPEFNDQLRIILIEVPKFAILVCNTVFLVWIIRVNPGSSKNSILTFHP